MSLLKLYDKEQEAIRNSPVAVLHAIAEDLVDFVPRYDAQELRTKEKLKDQPRKLETFARLGDVYKSLAHYLSLVSTTLDTLESGIRGRHPTEPLKELNTKTVHYATLMSQASSVGIPVIDKRTPQEVAEYNYQLLPKIKSREGLQSFLKDFSDEISRVCQKFYGEV